MFKKKIKETNKYKRPIIYKILYSFILIMLYVGMSIFFYPTISDSWNRYVSSRTIAEYNKLTDDINIDYTKDIEKAREYNKNLFATGTNHIVEYTAKISSDNAKYYEFTAGLKGNVAFPDTEYESNMYVIEPGVMGYINIPKIDQVIPIYHYTVEEVLEKGVGHLYGSSLPIGGENSHAVLTGHRGLPTSMLFTDLDKMVEGDIFTLNVLGLKLNYEVDQIKTVLPSEMNDLSIEKGQDYVTLITCTPYGVNSHRLLVRGHRVADDIVQEKTIQQQVITAVKAPVFIFACTGIILLIGLIILIRIWLS